MRGKQYKNIKDLMLFPLVAIVSKCTVYLKWRLNHTIVYGAIVSRHIVHCREVPQNQQLCPHYFLD